MMSASCGPAHRLTAQNTAAAGVEEFFKWAGHVQTETWWNFQINEELIEFQ